MTVNAHEPIDHEARRLERREARNAQQQAEARRLASLTLVLAGQEEFAGDDGSIYLIPLFNLVDRHGNTAAYTTPFGKALVIVRGDPIKVREDTRATKSLLLPNSVRR